MDHHADYWQMDNAGQLVNPAVNPDILQQFQPVLTALVTGITDEIGADLHSIYVSGSVALSSGSGGHRSILIEMITDEFVDPELVFQDWIEPLQDRIRAEFADLIDDVQLDLYPYYYVIRDPAEFSPAAFWLYAEAICVWGADIRPDLPVYDFRRSEIRVAVANDIISQFEHDLRFAKLEVQSAGAQPEAISLLQDICIAAVYHLTFPENTRYTSDRTIQLEDIHQFFTGFATIVDKPIPEDKSSRKFYATALLAFAETDVLPACETWLKRYNPNRDAFFLIEPDI